MGRHIETLQTPEKIDVLAAELTAHATTLQGIARVMRDNENPGIMAPNEDVMERAVATAGRFCRALTKAYRKSIKSRPNARPNSSSSTENPGDKSAELDGVRTRSEKKNSTQKH